MKRSIALSALLLTGFLAASTEKASAVVYCQYVDYPAPVASQGPGVVVKVRPVARAAVRHNAGGNANGGVNRVGVRRKHKH